MKKIINAFIIYLYDYLRHIKYSRDYAHDMKDKDSIRCTIMLLNHQLEKAQTYKDTKINYGLNKAIRLAKYLDIYSEKYGGDELFNSTLSVLESHMKHDLSGKSDELYYFYDVLKNKKTKINTGEDGGVELYNGNNVKKIIDLKEFLNNRKSCRTYSIESINDYDIENAIEMAIMAPSACNRQTTRVYSVKDKLLIKKIILAQKSDIDWCLGAERLLIITSNEKYWRGIYERNQKMFDAGLFSMILNLSLHNNNIGSCFKMANKYPKIDKNTKKIANIPLEEDICAFILVGKYPEKNIIVAKSKRLKIDDVLFYR
jgi:nitroreductase